MDVEQWYPFPPPDVGYYNIRRVFATQDQALNVMDFGTKRVLQIGSRLHLMGRRLSRMRADEGWQYQFLQQRENGHLVKWRPFAILYDLQGPAPVMRERRDISGVLPVARCIEEARYLVRQIPDRWPVFRHVHIEYTEEKYREQ